MMADMDERRESVRHSAQALVTCDICTERYKQPKVLPCQHTFCLPCLRGFFDSCNQQRILKLTNFPCPTCRKVCHLTPGGLDNLPNDFKVTQICDFLDKLSLVNGHGEDNQAGDKDAENGEGVGCDICRMQGQDAAQADRFCTQCAKYLCGDCQHHHQEAPVFGGHTTLGVSGQQAALKCPHHSGELLTYHCDDCAQTLCTVCALGTHSKHTLTHITTALVKQRHLLTATVDQLRDRLLMYENQAQDLASLRQHHQDMYTAAKDGIISTATAALENIKQQKEELLGKLEEDHLKVLTDLRQREEGLQAAVTSASQLCEAATAATLPDRELSLLGAYGRLQQQLGEALEQEVPQAGPPHGDGRVVFEATLGKIRLGVIHTHGTDTDPREQTAPNTDHNEHTVSELSEDQVDTVTEAATCEDTPKATNPKSVSFSLPQDNQESSAHPSDATTDSGFLDAKPRTESESDDEVFVDSASHQSSSQETLNDSSTMTSTYKVQLSAQGQTEVKLKWESKEFHDNKGVAFLPDGTLAATDYRRGGNRVKIYDQRGVPKRVMSGSEESSIVRPWAPAVNQQTGQILISDHGDSAVKALDGRLCVTQSLRRMFNKPCGVAVMKGGEFVVTDAGSRTHKVSVVLPSGLRVRDFATRGSDSGCLLSPNFITTDLHDRILISDCENHAIRIFDRLGKQLSSFTWKNTNGQLMYPQGVCVNDLNHILVADQVYQGVSLFSPDGRFIRHLVQTDSVPWGVSVHSSGLLALATEHGLQMYTL